MTFKFYTILNFYRENYQKKCEAFHTYLTRITLHAYLPRVSAPTAAYNIEMWLQKLAVATPKNNGHEILHWRGQ